jgi:hypothetical protein
VKHAIVLLLCAAPARNLLAVDESLAIPKVSFDASGNLVVKPSSTSSAADFDYLVGKWRLKNKKLKCRLNGCTEWSEEFESFVEMQKVLGGLGNIDLYHESVAGKSFEGLALRLFDPKTRLWSIRWVNGNTAAMDPPLTGSFEGRVGHFFGKDTHEGRDIIVVFRWDARNPALPVWSQAFSADKGKTWEWNSINVSERLPFK